MAHFKVNDWEIPAGTVAKGTFGQVGLAAGTKVSSPVVIVNGAQDGPVLVATGATHGNEIVGTTALLSTVRALDPTMMRGTLIAITVANPLAFEAASYGSPYDGLHMAEPMLWPAARAGTITQRLAASFRPALDQATHYIDVHGNADPAYPMVMLFPDQAADHNLRAEQRRMADATGLTPVTMLEPPDASGGFVGTVAGQPAAAASAHGIAGIMLELVSRQTANAAESGRIAIMNVMRRISMIDGELEQQPMPRLPGSFRYHGGLVNNHAGIFWAKRQPGELLKAGETIGEITDAWGDVVEEVTMPVTGFVWSYLGTQHGDTVMALPEGILVGFTAELLE
jgi:predicted deacylase